jgi:hypothetical protein
VTKTMAMAWTKVHTMTWTISIDEKNATVTMIGNLFDFENDSDQKSN